jgi:N-acetylglutamate synthase-like GNAT family acetyltransferase
VAFSIRKASTEDAKAIVEVLDYAPFLKDRYRGEDGISLVKDKIDLFWLAALDGRVASVMIVLPKIDFGCLEISVLVTKPEFERRGFARALTQKAKGLAAEMKLDLVAYPENEKSLTLLISERFELDPGCKSVQGFPRYSYQYENR